MSKKVGLGRGLTSLLQDTPKAEGISDIPMATAMNEILLSEIEVNPYQPRQNFDAEPLKELSDSIKIHGIIQPITVRRLSSN
jgi:ParB family chromosome partitioning protein